MVFTSPYVTYGMIVHAFRNAGIDVSSEQDTTQADLNRKVRAYNRLTSSKREELQSELRTSCSAELDPFFDALRNSLGRRITRIIMLALSGTSVQFDDVESAIRFVYRYDESAPPAAFDHYELDVRYSNGRDVQGSFPNKQDCIDFLRLLRRV